eukprot:2507955-Rhodomonas_salina.2
MDHWRSQTPTFTKKLVLQSEATTCTYPPVQSSEVPLLGGLVGPIEVPILVGAGPKEDATLVVELFDLISRGGSMAPSTDNTRIGSVSTGHCTAART